MPPRLPRHECVKELAKNYARQAEHQSDSELEVWLNGFESQYKGDKPGGDYQTVQWRIFKRIYRLEARRRGIT